MANANVDFLANHPNKQNGKAVADIKAVFFLKHENGIEPIVSQDLLESDKWFAALTLRSSVNANQDTPSFEEIRVDQFNQPIGLTTEPGAFSFECNCPSFVKEDLENFLGKGALKPLRGKETGSQVTIDGKPVYGFNLEAEVMSMCVMLITRTNDTIIFPNVQLALTFMQDGKTFAFKAAGQVMAPSRKANHFIYISHEPKMPVELINLDKTAIELTMGVKESDVLTAQVLPVDATDKSIEWSSSNEAVATVDQAGNVTAIGPGEAVIRVQSLDGGMVAASCDVTVIKHVESISLSKSESTLIKGTQETLVAEVLPSDASDKAVVWTSSDEAVVKVSADGKVSAIGAGNAIVTATTVDGGFEASCAYTVTVPVTGISLNKQTTTIIKGEEEVLVATILPSDATNKSVTWESDNGGVAEMGDDGRVIAIGNGTATITAKSVDGNFTAECIVTVVTPVTEVSVEPETLEINVGGESQLSAIVLPEDASDKRVTWRSSDINIATVDQDGNVHAISKGEVRIYADQVDGQLSGYCTLTVKVPVTGVELDQDSISIEVGATQTLIATVTPEDATDKSVIWESENDEIATVDENGVVTGISEGETTISVSTSDGGYPASCQVIVMA